MIDKSDFLNSIDPDDSGKINNSLSNAIDPEVLKGSTSMMDETYAKAVTPEMLKAISSTMDIAILKAIDPKLVESIKFQPISDFPRQFIPEFNVQISKSYAQLSFEDQQEYNEKSLKFLEEIRNNTATLATMIDLIAENNENQEILLQILSQMLEIATAKSQEELNGKFERLLDRIKNTMELGELTGKLLFYAYTIFSLVAPHIGK